MHLQFLPVYPRPPCKQPLRRSASTACALSMMMLLLLAQCSIPPPEVAEVIEAPRAEAVEGDSAPSVATPVEVSLPTNTSTAPNDAARFLAGMPPLGSDDAFRDLRATPHWQDHANRMDDLWRTFTLRLGQPVSDWASVAIGDLRQASAVFYPFSVDNRLRPEQLYREVEIYFPMSGPDFLFAHLFYPYAGTYLLCSLESCDPLPTWEGLTPGDVAAGCDGLYHSLEDILQFSYFITKDMKSDLQSTRFRGVLPVFLVFLSRTGHVVESIDAVRLDGNGNPVVISKSSGTPTGLLIRYSGAGGTKRLYYFKQDLGDEACKPNGPFLRFATSLGKPAALAKSASYLMHEPYFSNVRNHILTHCRGIVQDPSGIPYRAFEEHGWNVRLYGNYLRTLDMFQKYEQPDLVRAYQSGGGQPIGFGIGYLIEPATTSLMVGRPN